MAETAEAPLKKPSVASLAEEAFFDAIANLDTSPSVYRETHREHKFNEARGWRFDFAWPSIKLAVEIEGRGRHQTVVGFRNDCEKYNTAIAEGWRVLRFPATDYKPSKSRDLWPDGAKDWALIVLEVMCGAK